MAAEVAANASKKIVLVTGAAGFIASHITRGLVNKGYHVRAYDDLSGNMGWSRLEDLGDKIERITASILDKEALANALKGVSMISHHAALISVPESVARPLDYHDVDATATLQLLEAARKAGAMRVVYASSSAAYGEEPEQPKKESQRPVPISPYAIAKYTGELYVSAYAKLYGMQTIALRYFNVFGPGQNPKSQYGAAVPNIVSLMKSGKPPIVYGDGEQTRDFCHVYNVVHANLLALEAPRLKGEVVNIGTGKRVSVNYLVAQVNKLLGTNIVPTHEPPRAGDVRDSLADISLAKEVLGYEPQLQFEEGLAQLVKPKA
jgi:UDP-glucose 4-epimerase